MALTFTAAATATAALDPQRDPASIEAIRSAQAGRRLDLAGARPVARLTIDLVVGALHIREGFLVPTTMVAGHVREWVFVGDARLVIDPPDAIERQQIDLFTGRDRLDLQVREAVMVLNRDEAVAAMAARPAAAAPSDVADQARALHAHWRTSGERRAMRADDMVLLDALGDPLFAGAFGGLFRSDALGDVVVAVEPDAFEPVTVGRFDALDLSRRERRRAQRTIARAQRKGRFIGLEVDQLGAFESWMSMPLRDGGGEPRHGGMALDVEHYAIEATLAPEDLALDAVARLRLRAEAPRHAVRLTLASELRVAQVRDDGGCDLFFRQTGGELLVVLPRLTRAGERIDLEIAYGGAIVETLESSGASRLADTQGWYPRPAATDPATFEMTFRWPHDRSLFAAGTPGESGEERGMRWQRFTVDRPTVLASFEVGRYEVLTRRAGHVTIRFAFDPSADVLIRGDRAPLVDTVGDALRYFESIFGRYPYDHLTVVTAPRLLSQALPAMITLSTVTLSDQALIRALGGIEDPRAIVAHELAHQWWGHVVAWQSYRDQWISEAVANYAATSYLRNRLGRQAPGPTTGWLEDLIARTEDGRTIESLGPLVLGARLGAGPAPEAYSAIVYKKGAVVLDMLARRFGEARFHRMLGRVVEAAAGRTISTEGFLAAVARQGDTNLDAFARQFVYGTGLPDVVVDVGVEPLGDGRFAVRGSARQSSPFRFVYRIAATEQGSFDVVRQRIDQLDPASSRLRVPVVLVVADPARPDPGAEGRSAGERAVVHDVELSGTRTEVHLELDRAPRVVAFDPRQEVFARFHDRRRFPKQVLLLEGLDQAASGRHQGAMERLQEALVAPVTRGRGLGQPMSDRERAITRGRLDARIHLALARRHLDAGRPAVAERALDQARRARVAADRLVGRRDHRPGATAVVLAARARLARGDARGAYRLLNRALRKERRIGGAEAVALHAVTAHAVGETKALARSLEEARGLGVEVSALEDAARR